jgi:hypothetical protein
MLCKCYCLKVKLDKQKSKTGFLVNEFPGFASQKINIHSQIT